MNKLLITLCASSLVLSSYAGPGQSKESIEEYKKRDQLLLSKAEELRSIYSLHEKEVVSLEEQSPADISFNRLNNLREQEIKNLREIGGTFAIRGTDVNKLLCIYSREFTLLQTLYTQCESPEKKTDIVANLVFCDHAKDFVHNILATRAFCG